MAATVQQFLIYGLCDPLTGELRYVGKSSTGLTRPKQHKKPRLLKERSRKNSWIKSLMNQGLMYEIVVLETHDTPDMLDESERFWISSVRLVGADLLNQTDGGDGLPRGFRFTEETKARMSASQKARGTNGLLGYCQTPEHKKSISKALTGFTRPPRTAEHNRANALAQGGRPFIDTSRNLYFTIPEAVKATGLHYSTIHRSLHGRSSNLTFRYVTKE